MDPVQIGDFEKRTGIHRSDIRKSWRDVKVVAGLRELALIEELLVMPRDYLAALLKRVPLLGSPDILPFAGADFTPLRIDPRGVMAGQTFVERKKCLNLLENFQTKLTGFCITNGVAKCTAFIAYGRTRDGISAIAHYVPPIVEIHSSSLLLDGTHRNYLVMTVGTTLEAIVISGVSQAFPCAPVPWSEVRSVDEKPAKSDRHRELRPEMFRDLKFVGIDG